ncbi:ATP-binding protein [Spongiactinospora sp. TRM90649]|uniref:ATP-binding protein n=1 Tax=Spongiactinospora sp. TRM90649 TaxID=3031114 RepID=UPI0023F9F510|nr:ATP-binding protein [Spongiactinospora sp. TRM90649]MDF5754558.1 ATP-binding protein [Spongiactinospora sp. TRM90649]
MSGLLGWRLQAARELSFVGRREELAVFDAALRGNGCNVLFVHGPGGIGKSALLRRFAQQAATLGRPVARIDARVPVSTDEGFEAFAAFEAKAAPVLHDGNAVLLIDAFEQIQDMEGWLREVFLPKLPVGALVVVAGRFPPDIQWQADPGWTGALGVLPLRDLARDDARALVESYGVPADRAEPLLAFAGGHPLALLLGATMAARNGGPSERGPEQDVVATLLDQIVGEVPSPSHQQALEVCAHAYVTTEDLLRTFMPDEAATLFRWLRRLPFVESSSLGLYPHAVVREALEADFRWRDPQGHADMHERIRAHLMERVRTVGDSDVLGTVGALLYLHRENGESPVFHDAHRQCLVQEDVLRGEDTGALPRVAEAAEGAESAAGAAFWLERQPEAFRAYRLIGTGEPVAFSAWLRLPAPDDEEAKADPVVAEAWAHARATAPLRTGEYLAVNRTWVEPAHSDNSSVTDLLHWRAIGNSLRSQRMAWSYIAVRGPGEASVKRARRYGMEEIDEQPKVGDEVYGLYAHDWRALPGQAWLERLNGAPVSDPEARTTKLVVLTRVEFTEAIRQALRQMGRPDALAASPLTRTRLVTERGGPDPVGTLRDLLRQAIDDLGEDPRAAKFHRALSATYLNGAPTQELAAERLGLPFTTYRRHLMSGIERVCADLWRLELYGPPEHHAR